ncbi:MAG: DUF2726 domain-containing protein [Elusimicrobiota bacterium]|nr:DUF2726 domain-containing protein [Elusimicrobiota bacterium]
MARFTPFFQQSSTQKQAPTKPAKSVVPSVFSLLSVVLVFALIGVAGAVLVLYAKLKFLAFVGGRVESFRDRFLAGPERSARFHSKQSPLTEAEQELFRRLVKALPDHIVLSQVACSQFLYTEGGDRKENFGTMAMMKQKVADFMVCSQNFDIVAVIELDDSSHRDPAKDAKRDEMLKEAGLKTIRWHVSRKPDAAKIRWDVLGLKEGSDGEQVSRWAPRPT